MLTLTERLRQFRIITVITIERAQDIVLLGKALVANGLPVAEINFRTHAAAETIKILKETMSNRILIGAGTTLSTENKFGKLKQLTLILSFHQV
ncbi:MAG TPA: hypothetical protein ACHBX0_02720 [Arsenophonus sp.]